MALHSMTGYGRGEAALDDKTLVAEITSLNHKSREIRLGLTPELQTLEPFLNKTIGRQITRGTINLQIRLLPEDNNQTQGIRINHGLLRELTGQLQGVADELGLNDSLRIGDLLAIPGVVEQSQARMPLEKLQKSAAKALQNALEGLFQEREREGRTLTVEILDGIRRLNTLADKINRLRDAAISSYQKRLQERIALLQIDLSINDDRLAKEVAFAAQRTDITEELVRLSSHLDQFLQLVETAENQTVGRKLQFLCQELQREINTLAAKTGASEIARLALEFKSELEKIREQCSNIE